MSARSKTEAAMVALLKEYYSGHVYAGTRGDVKELPCVVVSVASGEEMPLGSGNTVCEVTVSVQDQIDEDGTPNSTDRFDDAVDRIQDAIRYDNFDAQLSAKASDFYCIGVMGRSGPETQHDDEQPMIAEVFTMSLLVAEADL